LPDRAPRVELDAAARGQAGAQALIEAAARATKDAAQQETTAAKGNGVAVLLAGTLVRYFPNLDRHVVAPLARSNRTVDVYLSLSVEGFISWRSHGNRFVMHPAYVGKDLDEVKDMIVEGIRDHGGTAAAVRMPTQVNLTSHGQAFVDHGNWWSKDPTTKYAQNLEHAKTTRRNIAKLYKELDDLWTVAKENEVTAGDQYEYVMIFRDDSNWLLDFDLDRLVRAGGRKVIDGSAGRAFGQKCGPEGLPRLCDYVVVAERAIAEPFCSFYKMMTDPTSMGVSLDPRSETVLEGERYLYQLTKALHIRFEEVPTALIPFERCGRVNISGTVSVCQHKPTDEGFNGIPKLGVQTMVPDICENLP